MKASRNRVTFSCIGGKPQMVHPSTHSVKLERLHSVDVAKSENQTKSEKVNAQHGRQAAAASRQ